MQCFIETNPSRWLWRETVEAAKEGAHLMRVQYEMQKPRVSLAPRAAEGYSPAKAGGGGDPSTSSRGDVKLGLTQADARIEHVYETPFEVHNPMEPHSTMQFGMRPIA